MIELKRERYLSRIRPFYRDADVIKVLTGVRRCGKSTILRQIIRELREEGVDSASLVYIDLDSKKHLGIKTSDALERLIDSEFGDCQGSRYLFIDEIQNVKDFEPLINAYRNDGASVFITGSNSYLLSGELTTKLTGRYIEFRIFTFSLGEVKALYQANSMAFIPSDAFQEYLMNGGYPKSFEYSDQESKSLYIRSVIDETIKKDILKSRKVRNKTLIGKLLDYILSTPGAEISSTSIADYLRSEHVRTTPNTVNSYLDLIFSSKLADKCLRFDIFGKKALKTHYKSYVADISLHTSYPSRRHDLRMGHILENIVFNELNSRGYDVQVGKLGDAEVDFVVSNGRDIAYIQVTYLIASPDTEEREERPLLRIVDNYPKYIISMDPIAVDRKGIKRLRLVEDFLLGDGFKF